MEFRKKNLNVKVNSIYLEAARNYCKIKGIKIDDLIDECFHEILVKKLNIKMEEE